MDFGTSNRRPAPTPHLTEIQGKGSAAKSVAETDAGIRKATNERTASIDADNARREKQRDAAVKRAVYKQTEAHHNEAMADAKKPATPVADKTANAEADIVFQNGAEVEQTQQRKLNNEPAPHKPPPTPATESQRDADAKLMQKFGFSQQLEGWRTVYKSDVHKTSIVDENDRLVVKGGVNEDAIRATIALAQSRGWPALVVTSKDPAFIETTKKLSAEMGIVCKTKDEVAKVAQQAKQQEKAPEKAARAERESAAGALKSQAARALDKVADPAKAAKTPAPSAAEAAQKSQIRVQKSQERVAAAMKKTQLDMSAKTPAHAKTAAQLTAAAAAVAADPTPPTQRISKLFGGAVLTPVPEKSTPEKQQEKAPEPVVDRKTPEVEAQEKIPAEQTRETNKPPLDVAQVLADDKKLLTEHDAQAPKLDRSAVQSAMQRDFQNGVTGAVEQQAAARDMKADVMRDLLGEREQGLIDAAGIADPTERQREVFQVQRDYLIQAKGFLEAQAGMPQSESDKLLDAHQVRVIEHQEKGLYTAFQRWTDHGKTADPAVNRNLNELAGLSSAERDTLAHAHEAHAAGQDPAEVKAEAAKSYQAEYNGDELEV